MKNKTLVAIIFVLSTHAVWSQLPTLTLQDAISTGLKNNYSILIAENNQASNKYARNIGNAGMLPTIGVGGSASYSNTNVRQEQANGNIISSDAAVSTNYTASAGLSWTLFDGLKMFATYDKLTEIRDQSVVRTKFEMETTVSNIMRAYFDIVRNQHIYSSILETISVGEERVTIAQKKFDIGSGAKTEVLQSKIDLNNLRTMLSNQQILIYEAKTNLNQLMARDVATEFEVEDTIPIGDLLVLADIRKESLTGNSLVRISEYDVNIYKYARREINSLRMPKLIFNAGYNYNRAQNQAGFLLLNQNYGFNTGITLSYNIFDSWRVNTQYKTATFNLESSKYNLDLIKLQTDAQVVNTYNKYSNFLTQITIEQESMNMADENVTLSLARFKDGYSNFLELREAQRSYIETVTAYVGALYNAKIQEIELLRLKGELIK
jgi:outer membrane protein